MSTSARPAGGLYDEPEELSHTHVVEQRLALKVRKCRLVVTAGPGSGAQLVSEKERLRLGKDPENDLAVNERTVSRQHAEILFTDKGYLLADLDSTNGTFLDGRRVERAFLTPGAVIQLGDVSKV